MADSRVNDLPDAAPLDGDELLYVVDDPGGTPTDAKISVDDLTDPHDADPSAHNGTLVAQGDLVVNVKDHGAVGDGVADDRAAIQAALALGGITFFPDGTYNVSAPLLVASNAHLVGSGRGRATIRLTVSVEADKTPVVRNAGLLVGNTGIVVEDLGIDGGGLVKSRGVVFENSTDCVVRRCRLTNCGLAPVNLREGSARCWVVDNVIDTFGDAETGHGVSVFRSANDNIVSRNIIVNGTANSTGILVDDATTDSLDSLSCYRNILSDNIVTGGLRAILVEGSLGTRIVGNVCRDQGYFGIYVYAGQFPTLNEDVVIANNHVTGTTGAGGVGAAIAAHGRGIIITGNTVEGMLADTSGINLGLEGAAAYSQDVAIVNNVIRDYGVGASGPGIRVASNECHGLRVAGNLLRGVPHRAIWAGGAGRSWQIVDNVIDGASLVGIYLVVGASTLVDVMIERNIVRDPNTSNTANTDGILISGTGLSRVSVKGNVITDAAVQMRYGVRVSSGTDVTLFDNKVTGAATGETSHAGTGYTVKGSDLVSVALRKTADQTVNNDDTENADLHLNFAIGANEVWIARWVLFVESGAAGATADFKAGLTLPSGATCIKGVLGPATTATGTGTAVNHANRTRTDATASGVGAIDSGMVTVVMEATITNGATAGTVTLTHAQNVATVTDTTVKAGSHLTARKVA